IEEVQVLADVQADARMIAILVGDRGGQDNEVVRGQRDAVIGVVGVRMLDRTDLVERNIARAVNRHGEGKRAASGGDVTFDHPAIVDQDNRRTGGDIDEAARYAVAARDGQRIAYRTGTVGTERAAEGTRERLRVVGR